jgi:hypothetical protein
MIRQNKESQKSLPKNPDSELESEKSSAIKSPPSQLFAGADAGSNKGNERPVQQKQSPSSGMPEDVQGKMEGAFGQDFSDVKIHANSSQSTEMGALAHAQGNEIHFAPGQYNPSSQSGQELLGHELTHVVQQREGRVQPTTSVGGAAVNDDKSLEKEADELGSAAAKGATQLKASSGSKPGAQAKKGPVQRKVLANGAEKDDFFKQYRERAEGVLAGWYEKTKTKDGRDQLTGTLFENAARKIYDAKGDTKYIVPVEFALAQARLEGGVSRNERLGKGNVFNVGAYDSGVSDTETKLNSLEKGFDAYYSFMASKMLDDKTPEQLLEKGNFTTGANRTGGVYATNPVYEGHIKGEIGKMNMKDAKFSISSSVGIGAKNKPEDVEKVGNLLAKIGYLSATDVKDSAKVGDAILKFQTTEIAPEGEKWFKDRMKWVTNPTDIKNMQIQLEGLKDGVVSNSGTTLGVIYFMAAMGGKVQTAGGVSKDGATTKPATPATNTPTTPKPEVKPSTPQNTTTKPTATNDKSWWESAYDTIADAASTTYDVVASGASSAYDTVAGWFGGSEPAKKPTTPVAPVTTNKPAVVTPPAPVNNSIKDSVGKGGKNNKADVLVVQALLVKAGYLPAKNASGGTNIDGDCGPLTEGAISKFQREKAGLNNPDGRVDPNGVTWSALTGKPVAKPETPTSGGGSSNPGTKTPTEKPKTPVAARDAATTGDIFESIKANNPNGITVSLYADYAKTGDKAKDGNNAEFPRAAGKFAKTFSSIGVDAAGQLKIGMAVPITSLDEITSNLKGITDALGKEYKKSNPNATEMPAFTKIKRLCLFSHGMQWGMHLGASGRYNLRIDSEAERKKFKEFIAGIKGTLAADVVVDLFACNAGRESDGTEKDGVWGYDAAKKQDGSSSFAAAMAEELGKDASVYGHLSAGHTVNNYSARVFGKDAGKDATKDKGGVHTFDLLYPQTFIDSEATRLKKDAKAVKTQMWKHYTQRMSDGHTGKFSITNSAGKSEKVELGAEMFADIGRAKTILQTDWVTWVTSNPVK